MCIVVFVVDWRRVVKSRSIDVGYMRGACGLISFLALEIVWTMRVDQWETVAYEVPHVTQK